MANINLHQSFERAEDIRKKPSFFSGRTFVSIMIIVIFSATYFGLKYYQSVLNKQKQAIVDSKNAELATIDREAVGGLIDFKKRTDDISTNLKQKNSPAENFSNLEKVVLSPVYLDGYAYDYTTGILKITAITGSFQTVAEQLLNFKKSGYFTNIEITGTQRNQEGQIVFDLQMKLATAK